MSKISVARNNLRGSSKMALAIDDVIFLPEKTMISESKAELQSDSEGGDSFFEVEILDKKLADMVMTHRFSDLSREIKRIVIHSSLNLINGETEISQGIAIRRSYVGVRGGYVGQTYIAFNFYFDPDNWKQLWSIREYQKEFRRIFAQQNLADIRWTPEEARIEAIGSIADRISLSVPIQDADTTIETEARKHSGVLSKLHELTITSLMSKLRQESVVMYFNFPDEVRVPCEQYLLYFVQFLRDLGVEATAELQHDAGQVLFAVTPTDRQQALDTIRTALETYLQLPSTPFSSSESVEYQVAIQRLAANIDHLKGQLRLAHAELLLANATPQARQVKSSHLLTDEIMIESLTEITPKAEGKDEVKLFGGIITLTTYESKGVKVNLAEIFRRLKQLLARKK